MSETILSLCDYTGTWPKPYLDAGYEVIQLDTQHDPTADVRLFKYETENTWHTGSPTLHRIRFKWRKVAQNG